LGTPKNLQVKSKFFFDRRPFFLSLTWICMSSGTLSKTGCSPEKGLVMRQKPLVMRQFYYFSGV
jgi:hypothetical protein